MDQDRFRDLSADFLLGRLDEPELAEFQAELERRGEEGQAELGRMREAVASLALATPPVLPSPRLREQLLSRIAEDEEGREEPGGGERKVVPVRRRGREWAWAAGIAAALALLLGLWNVNLRRDVERAEGELLVERARRAAADSIVSRLQADARDLAAVASPRGSAHTLVGTQTAPQAVARIFVDPETGRALLFAFDLPILPPDKVYELWAIRDGTPVPVTTFAPGSDRRARVELQDLRPFEDVDVLAVTVEPAPGTQAPTGQMVLSTS